MSSEAGSFRRTKLDPVFRGFGIRLVHGASAADREPHVSARLIIRKVNPPQPARRGPPLELEPVETDGTSVGHGLEPFVLLPREDPQKRGMLDVIEVAEGVLTARYAFNRQDRCELPSFSQEKYVSMLEAEPQVVGVTEHRPIRVGHFTQKPPKAHVRPALRCAAARDLGRDPDRDERERSGNGEPAPCG